MCRRHAKPDARHPNTKAPLAVNEDGGREWRALITNELPSDNKGALVGGGGGGHQIIVRNAHRLRAGARTGTAWMRRDSKLWVRSMPELRDELWAALAGTPVPRGQGWLAGIFRCAELSNSGAACAIQGRIALTRTICGLAR
jgi:hypothetical protein